MQSQSSSSSSSEIKSHSNATPCKFSLDPCKVHHHIHDLSCDLSSFYSSPEPSEWQYLGWCALFDALLSDSTFQPSHSAFLSAYPHGTSRLQILCFLDFHLALRLRSHPSPHPRFLAFLFTWVQCEWQTFLLPDHAAATSADLGFSSPSLSEEYPFLADPSDFPRFFWEWAEQSLQPQCPDAFDNMHRIIRAEHLKHASWRALSAGALPLQRFAAIHGMQKHAVIPPRHSKRSRSLPSLSVLCCRALSRASVGECLRHSSLWSVCAVTNVLDIHPDDFARQLQLAMLCWMPYCMSLWGLKSMPIVRSPVLARYYAFHNAVHMLLESQLLLRLDAAWFEDVMTWGILVATKLRGMNNLDGLSLVCCALLKKLPRGCVLAPKYRAYHKSAVDAVSSDSPYLHVRRAHSSDQYLIPYLGMILTDLTFVTEGNRFVINVHSLDELKKRERMPVPPTDKFEAPLQIVNWQSYIYYSTIAQVWHSKIERYLQFHGCYQAVVEIQRFIHHPPMIFSEDELIERRDLMYQKYRR